MKYEIETKKIENFILNRVSMAVLSGVKGAVLGISGGIDSALVATLCVRALGKQNVHGLLLPFGFDRMEDAVLMVGQLGIKNTTIDIEPICRSIGLTGNKTVDGNIKARARMICLYKYAN
jgi:NAD+ synthase